MRTSYLNHPILFLLWAISPVTFADALRLPDETSIRVQFLEPLRVGQAPAGRTVEARVLESLTDSHCVLIHAGSVIQGRTVSERSGGWFGRKSRVAIEFERVISSDESDERGRTRPFPARLHSLEWRYSPKAVSHDGVVGDGHSPVAAAAMGGVGVLVAGAVGIAAAPFGLATAAFYLVRPQPSLSIHAGDVARVKTVEPIDFERPAVCHPPETADFIALPPLPARTLSGVKGAPGDPVNLVFRGNESDLLRAFERAHWTVAKQRGFISITGAVFASALQLSYRNSPMSSQYLFGRSEDYGVQRAGRNARERHHARLWAANRDKTLWAASANEDIGIVVKPLKGVFTHRIDANIDMERDLIVLEMTATGCATLDGYRYLNGFILNGINAQGAPFHTDGRVAVLSVHDCDSK